MDRATEAADPFWVERLEDGRRRVTVFARASRTRREESRIIGADEEPWEAMADIIKMMHSCIVCPPEVPVKVGDLVTVTAPGAMQGRRGRRHLLRRALR